MSIYALIVALLAAIAGNAMADRIGCNRFGRFAIGTLCVFFALQAMKEAAQ